MSESIRSRALLAHALAALLLLAACGGGGSAHTDGIAGPEATPGSVSTPNSPAPLTAEPTPPPTLKPGNAWNQKLSFPFTGGANPGFRSGRNVVTSALQDVPLSLGFAVAFGTRNVLGTGNDDLVSAMSRGQLEPVAV